ncbi:MAG: hypothetical protein Kow00127_14190 [Bacteroidales bacterium]
MQQDDFYHISSTGQMVRVAFGKRVFDLVTDVEKTEQLVGELDRIDHDSEIKALLIYNQPGALGEEDYVNFMNRLSDDQQPTINGKLTIRERNMRFRQINLLNMIIRKLSQMQKLVISALQGRIVTPFFGAALVADFRYAAEGTEFIMIHNRYGLHPSGALPFFLSQMVHHSRALELQLKEKITADEALSYDLIHEILPREGFIDHVGSIAGKQLKWSYSTLRDTKRLTNWARSTLSEYLQFEAGLLNL